MPPPYCFTPDLQSWPLPCLHLPCPCAPPLLMPGLHCTDLLALAVCAPALLAQWGHQHEALWLADYQAEVDAFKVCLLGWVPSKCVCGCLQGACWGGWGSGSRVGTCGWGGVGGRAQPRAAVKHLAAGGHWLSHPGPSRHLPHPHPHPWRHPTSRPGARTHPHPHMLLQDGAAGLQPCAPLMPSAVRPPFVPGSSCSTTTVWVGLLHPLAAGCGHSSPAPLPTSPLTPPPGPHPAPHTCVTAALSNCPRAECSWLCRRGSSTPTSRPGTGRKGSTPPGCGTSPRPPTGSATGRRRWGADSVAEGGTRTGGKYWVVSLAHVGACLLVGQGGQCAGAGPGEQRACQPGCPLPCLPRRLLRCAGGGGAQGRRQATRTRKPRGRRLSRRQQQAAGSWRRRPWRQQAGARCVGWGRGGRTERGTAGQH